MKRKTKLELQELHAQFVSAVALGSDHAMRNSDIDDRCRSLVAYLSGFLADKMPVQAAQLAKVCGLTEGFSK